MIEVLNGVPNPRVEEAVLFSFDDVSIPFTAGLRRHLIGSKQRGSQPPWLYRLGPPGSPDDSRTTVLWHGYSRRRPRCGCGTSRKTISMGRANIAPATPRAGTGVYWERPDLGLIEFRWQHGEQSR